MLKPYEWSIKACKGKSHLMEHLHDFDNLIKRKIERGVYYIADQNLLKPKKKPTDLLVDEDTGYTGPRREKNT